MSVIILKAQEVFPKVIQEIETKQSFKIVPKTITSKKRVSFSKDTKTHDGLSKDNKFFNQLMYDLLGGKKYFKNLLGRMIAAAKSKYLKKMNVMIIDLIERCIKDNEPDQKNDGFIKPGCKITTPILPRGGGYNLAIDIRAVPYLKKKVKYIKDQIQLLEDYDFMYELGEN